MITDNYETTEFSNNNFAIIGRMLFIATKYEKTFRAYFTILAMKYLPFYVSVFKEFSCLEPTDISEANLQKVCDILSKLSFHKIITYYFDKIIDKELPTDKIKVMFIKAKKTRNYIAHELCNCNTDEIEKDSFRRHLQNEMEDELKRLIECVLFMENAISVFNKAPPLVNTTKGVNKIFTWIIDLVE